MKAKKLCHKAAWVLLLFCLLTGGGISAPGAGDNPGVQLVLVLDLPPAADHAPAAGRVSQAADLLIRLLPDQAYLGLCAPGMELAAAQLGTAERREITDALAIIKPPAQPQPFADILTQSLKLFQPGGPEKRGLLIISDGAGAAEPPKKTADLKEITRMAAQARKAGVAIFAASKAPGFSPDELQALTMATGGRFWDARNASDIITNILNFYERLGQHQQAPLSGDGFRLDPWVKRAVVVALRSVPGKAVVLTTPARARLTPRTRDKTTSWVAGQDYDLITISAPHPGPWSLAWTRPAGSRIFLDTDVTLNATGVPRLAGADEALTVTAALEGPEQALAGPEGLAGTEFLAELQMNHDKSLAAELRAPAPGDSSDSSLNARVGRFPPLHQEGEATLRLSAMGKTFQRSIELPVTITRPWYRVAMPAAAAPDVPPISFQPDPKRHPQPVEGTVTLQSAQGSLAGALIKPAPGSPIIMSKPAGCQDTCLADLQLTATAPGGYSLVIASGPQRLTIPPAASEAAAAPADKENPQKKIEATHTPSEAKQSKRRWLWLALSVLGTVFFLGAGVLFWLDGRKSEGNEDQDGAPGQGDPRQEAKLDVLMKEKAQLQVALDEKKRQTQQLEKEKADLQAELERTKTKSEGSVKTLEELEKKLEEAEKAAEGFQQEYMALYARNEEEKNTIKKG